MSYFISCETGWPSRWHSGYICILVLNNSIKATTTTTTSTKYKYNSILRRRKERSPNRNASDMFSVHVFHSPIDHAAVSEWVDSLSLVLIRFRCHDRTIRYLCVRFLLFNYSNTFLSIVFVSVHLSFFRRCVLFVNTRYSVGFFYLSFGISNSLCMFYPFDHFDDDYQSCDDSTQWAGKPKPKQPFQYGMWVTVITILGVHGQ